MTDLTDYFMGASAGALVTLLACVIFILDEEDDDE